MDAQTKRSAVNAQPARGRVTERPQAGALCYRQVSANAPVEVLLVASLRNGRWGLPKGHVDKGETTKQAALREAFEEAGIRGEADGDVFGKFSYYKEGKPDRFCVFVHLVAYSEQVNDYPEKFTRRAKWVSITIAAREASRSGLRTILKDFEKLVKARV
jgi:8-oxo-dGTP pyrophosphatase MutT (NUDIX family)